MRKLILGQVYYHSEEEDGEEVVTIFRPYLFVDNVDKYLLDNKLRALVTPWPNVEGYICEMIRSDTKFKGTLLEDKIGACTFDSRLVRDSIPYDRYDIEQDVKDIFNGGE